MMRHVWNIFARMAKTFRRVFRVLTKWLPSRQAELRKITIILANLEHITVGVFQCNFPRCLLSLNSDKTITIRHPSGKKYTTQSFDSVDNAMIDDGFESGVRAMNEILADAHSKFLGLDGIPDEIIPF